MNSKTTMVYGYGIWLVDDSDLRALTDLQDC